MNVSKLSLASSLLILSLSGTAYAGSYPYTHHHGSYSYGGKCGPTGPTPTPGCVAYTDEDKKELYTSFIFDSYSWTHSGVGTEDSITSAELKIKAYDVDFFDYGEMDKVFAYDTDLADWAYLGNLKGYNNSSYTTSFTLGSSWFDELASGLQLKVLFTTPGWGAKIKWSKVIVDGEHCPDDVSPVPVPAAAWLFAPAMLGFTAMRRRTKKS